MRPSSKTAPSHLCWKCKRKINPKLFPVGFLSLLLSLKSQHIIRLSCFSPLTISLSFQKALCRYKISEAAKKKYMFFFFSSNRGILENSPGLIKRKDIGENTGKYLLRCWIDCRKIEHWLKPENPKHKTNRVVGFFVFCLFLFGLVCVFVFCFFLNAAQISTNLQIAWKTSMPDLELNPAQTEKVRQRIAKARFHLLHANIGKKLQKHPRSEVFYFWKAAHSQM